MEGLKGPYDKEVVRAFLKEYIEVDTNSCIRALGDHIEDLLKE